jgi:hypothetical protein
MKRLFQVGTPCSSHSREALTNPKSRLISLAEYDLYAQGFRSIRLLDVEARRLADELAWPMPFGLEMQTCGTVNATWSESTRKLTLCYELAAEFAELYRDYNDKLMVSKRK